MNRSGYMLNMDVSTLYHKGGGYALFFCRRPRIAEVKVRPLRKGLVVGSGQGNRSLITSVPITLAQVKSMAMPFVRLGAGNSKKGALSR